MHRRVSDGKRIDVRPAAPTAPSVRSSSSPNRSGIKTIANSWSSRPRAGCFSFAENTNQPVASTPSHQSSYLLNAITQPCCHLDPPSWISSHGTIPSIKIRLLGGDRYLYHIGHFRRSLIFCAFRHTYFSTLDINTTHSTCELIR